MLPLETPLIELKHIGPKYAERLHRLGLFTIADLLFHFPSRYEDFVQFSPIEEAHEGETVTVQGVIESVETRQAWRKRMIITEAWVRDEGGLLKAIWFNQPYLKNILTPGRTINLSGKLARSKDGLLMQHPNYELINKTFKEELPQTRHTARLVPIYPETQRLTSRALRFFIQPLLEVVDPLKEWVPENLLKKQSLPEINQALRQIHFPESIEEAHAARERFAFEELFLLQLVNAEERKIIEQEAAPPLSYDLEEMKKLLKELPFTLTLSQKKSLWEILQSIEKKTSMNRLLQGDVGSGKTVVVALASIVAAQNGFQVAFLAPTEILALQHFATLKKLFASILKREQPALGLLTGSQTKILYENDLETKTTKASFKEKMGRGEIKIIIGTHALLTKDVRFKNLGLVIVDEQHRFGVKQRASLLGGRSNTNLYPHFLSMSATPIPRTLTMALFGNLDVSTITELPHGRKPIVTRIVPPEKRTAAYDFIRKIARGGQQVFVICPRIEPMNEEIDQKIMIRFEIKSAKEEHQKLSKQIFPDLRVGLLHGQMKAKDKEKIMNDFKEKRLDILVSTSVIEIGVDVPNATVMMIEGAERFGLAQLHQFRGRVGRGEKQSYCLLFTESHSPSTTSRLKAMIAAKNGFELAEVDLKLRGPGQFLGKEQTGLPDLLMRGLTDIELIKKSREAALSILEENPDLSSFPLLQEKIVEFKKKLHQE